MQPVSSYSETCYTRWTLAAQTLNKVVSFCNVHVSVLLDEDVHKCGRCQTEFSTLEAFIQHKLQHNCKRVQASSQEAIQEVWSVSMCGIIWKNSRGRTHADLCILQVTAANGSSSSSEVKTAAGASSEPVKTTNGGSTYVTFSTITSPWTHFECYTMMGRRDF